jgi:hypothetical protein
MFGTHSNTAIALESWGWFLEWTPAFIGSGMLVGLNVAISYLIGSVLAWSVLSFAFNFVWNTNVTRGIIGPLLVAQGIAFGTPASDDPRWSGYMSYSSLSKQFTTANHPSPRYWLLWPGVLCMIAVSFTGKCLIPECLENISWQ